MESTITTSFALATEKDIAAIIELCNECFFEKTNLNYAYKVFQETMHDPNQIYIIGKIDDQIIAHAKLTIVPTIYEDMNTYCLINHFCVKEEFRRHNIATQMLEEIQRIAKEHQCKTLKLWSNNFRIPAHTCYKKFGFIINDATFFSKDI